MAATIQQIVKPTRARGLDTSGNNNHAQIYSGRALEFDGVTDYLTGPTTFPHSDTTIAIWINQDDATGEYRGIVGRDSSGGGNANWSIWWNAGLIRMFIADTSSNYETIQSTTTLQSNTWYRLVCTIDFANKTGKIYLNGVLDTTVTWTRTHREDSDAILIGTLAESAAYHWTGKMSDAQIWNSTWTAADAEYDYLNPEQLALNRGGTSLTNSNLKLWYPMNEGHRGNQSYVLDASNTGLGNEKWDSDKQSGNSSGWVNYGNNEVTVEEDAVKVTYVNSAAGAYLYLRDALTLDSDLTVGQTYKVTVDAKINSGSAKITYDRTGGGDLVDFGNLTTEFATYEYIFIAKSASSSDLRFNSLSSGEIVYVKNFSLKPINGKHNATTVFYGNEMITDSKNRDFGSSSDWAVLNIAGGSLTEPSNKLQIVTSTDEESEGTQLAIAELTTPVVGRTYRISAELQQTSGATTPQIGLQFAGTGSSYFNISASAVTYYKDVVAGNTTGNLKIFNTSSDSSTTFTIDNISVKEVGTAKGWTDADQQLDIPQTALQSYNQLAWPHGASNHQVNIADGDSDMKFTTGDFSISFWFMPNSDTLDGYVLSKGAYHTSGYYIYYDGSTQKVYYQTNQSSAGQANNSSALTLGKWHHCVVTIKDSGTDSTWYINGELDEVKTNHFHPTEDTRNLQLYNRGGGSGNANFGLTELSFWNKTLSFTEVEEIYDNGVALDVTTHSASSDLLHYWRNGGLGTWIDRGNAGSLYNGTPTNITETMLITAGVDSSRDSQGFLMNRQRLTNSLNLDFIEFDNTNIIASEARTFKSNDFDFGTGHISVDAWIKTRQTGEGGFIVTCQSDGYQKEGFGLRISGGDDIWFVVGDGSKFYSATEGTHVNDNEWHHICGVYDSTGGSQSAKYYLDGVLKNTDTTTTDFAGTPNTDAGDLGAINVTSDGTDFHGLSIGGQSWNVVNTTNQDFEGQIDDVRVYKGKALSQTEVLRNFKAGKRSHK